MIWILKAYLFSLIPAFYYYLTRLIESDEVKEIDKDKFQEAEMLFGTKAAMWISKISTFMAAVILAIIWPIDQLKTLYYNIGYEIARMRMRRKLRRLSSKLSEHLNDPDTPDELKQNIINTIEVFKKY